jgi:phage shock protein E
MKKTLLIFISAISFYACAQKQNTTVVTNVTPDEFHKLYSADKNAVIIDLRTDDELKAKGYIPGSVQLDWLAKDNEQQVDKLDKNKTYYIYCASGGRSGECAEYMEKHKFKKVVNLERGFTAWMSKGLPVEKK